MGFIPIWAFIFEYTLFTCHLYTIFYPLYSRKSHLILIQNGYTPVIIQNKKRITYLDAIESWQQNNNKEKFYEIIIEYENESLEIYLETINKRIIWK
jgi:hypothetical protein